MTGLVINRPRWVNWVSSDRDVQSGPPFEASLATSENDDVPKISGMLLDDARTVREVPSSEKEWVNKTIERLGQLSQVPANWNSYGGMTLDPGVRDKAVSYLGWLEQEDLPAPGVFLGSRGSVQLEWQFHGKELEIEIEPSGSVGWLKVFPNDATEEGAFDRPSAVQFAQLTHWLTRS